SSKEISYLLSKEKSLRLTKSETSKLIFKHLKKRIDYDNKNYVYSLKTQEPELIFDQKSDLDSNLKINTVDPDYIIDIVQKIFKEKYIDIKTGNKKMDYLIKSIVK